MFMEQSCPKNKQLAVLTKLEGTSWYQARDMVENYIDQFQELIDVVEYDDDKTIVIKFCKGLNPVIQTRWHLLEIMHRTLMIRRVGMKQPGRSLRTGKQMKPLWSPAEA